MNESVKVTVVDDDNGKDETVGETILKASDLNIPPFRPTRVEPAWIKLSLNGKPAGQIKLHCIFTPIE